MESLNEPGVAYTQVRSWANGHTHQSDAIIKAGPHACPACINGVPPLTMADIPELTFWLPAAGGAQARRP